MACVTEYESSPKRLGEGRYLMATQRDSHGGVTRFIAHSLPPKSGDIMDFVEGGGVATWEWTLEAGVVNVEDGCQDDHVLTLCEALARSGAEIAGMRP